MSGIFIATLFSSRNCYLGKCIQSMFRGESTIMTTLRKIRECKLALRDMVLLENYVLILHNY